MPPSRRQIQFSHIKFQPIIQIDPAHSRAAVAARQPQGLTVNFAPFTLPSSNDPGTIDDSTITHEDSSEEDSSDDKDSSDDETKTDSNSICDEAVSSRPVAEVTNHHHSPSMPRNPLAYPRRTSSALATKPESLSQVRNNTKKIHKPSSADTVKSAGSRALPQGRRFSRFRATTTGGSKPAAQKSSPDIINLISDDESEDKAPPTSHRVPRGFIINKPLSLPPAFLPVSSAVSSSSMAQESQIAFSGPANDRSESSSRQSYHQPPPQRTSYTGIKQEQVVDSAIEAVVATPRLGMRDNILQPPPGLAACKDFDPGIITIPADRRHETQPGPAGLLSGLLHPSLATAQHHLHGLPCLPPQVTHVRRATGLAKLPPTSNQLQTNISSVKNSNNQTPTTKTAAIPTPVISKVGSRNAYSVNTLDTPVTRVSKQSTVRDRMPEYNPHFNDLDSDTDDNDVLANITRFTRRDRGQPSPARYYNAPHRLYHSAGSNRGEQDKWTRPVSSAKGQGEREEKKKTVQPSVQQTKVPSIGTSKAIQGSSPGVETFALAEHTDKFEAIMGSMRLDLERAGLQVASSSGQMANIHMRRPGTMTIVRGVANGINTFQDGARSAEHASDFHRSQEQPQHTRIRKRKTEQTEDIREMHEKVPNKYICLSSDSETQDDHRISRGARKKYPVELEDKDDHIDVGVVASHINNASIDHVRRTLLSTAGFSATTPAPQVGTKRARSSAGLKLRPWEAAHKRPRMPTSKLSKIVRLHYVPANLPSKLRRIMIMGTDPKKPVGSKCFFLERAWRCQGAGYIETPVEVRLEIYRYLLVADKPIEVLRGWSEFRRRQNLDLHPALLYSCRQTHDEATEVLYSENRFRYALRDDAEMVALGQGDTWQRIMPLTRHIHHFRNLELVLQRSGTDKEEYTMAIYKAISSLNFMGANKLEKLTIVTRPDIEIENNQVSMTAYFQSDNNVIGILKRLQADFIQVDVHLPETNSETAKKIRTIIDKRIEIGSVEILRRMDEQTKEEKDLGKEERRRLAEAQLVKKSKEAIDAQLHRLGTRIYNACTKGAAWVLQRGWFIEFESDAVTHDAYMNLAPHDDTGDTNWEA